MDLLNQVGGTLSPFHRLNVDHPSLDFSVYASFSCFEDVPSLLQHGLCISCVFFHWPLA